MREVNVEAEKNIALLIDADNASPDHLDEVLLVLDDGHVRALGPGRVDRCLLRGDGSDAAAHAPGADEAGEAAAGVVRVGGRRHAPRKPLHR